MKNGMRMGQDRAKTGSGGAKPLQRRPNLAAVLLQALIGHTLGQGDAGDAARLRAGHVLVPSLQQELRHLRGFTTTRISGHQHHAVLRHGAQDGLPEAGDGQRCAIPPDFGQFGEALLLVEVQIVQQGAAQLCPVPAGHGGAVAVRGLGFW